ncbi:MAG TPA: MarR family transcriptional regulator [Spirochaetales bacterium]|nr:MarR family transcriptional regulator [Spirochaetales bacterium]HRY54969.1 MarR family transcriptional regulator [Spirochaetia bacterium]HRZ64844.1 MarR family transcriptional regulator [Spirochaetia bacterium]
MSYRELLLSNQLCFLVHRLDLGIASKYRPALAKLGLTYGQYLAMLALWERREATVSELCGALELDTGTVSPLVKRLEAAGLVERARSLIDERQVLVRLTRKGAALEEKARSVPGSLAGCLVADEADYARIRAFLEELLERLGPCGPGPDEGTNRDPARGKRPKKGSRI